MGKQSERLRKQLCYLFYPSLTYFVWAHRDFRQFKGWDISDPWEKVPLEKF